MAGLSRPVLLLYAARCLFWGTLVLTFVVAILPPRHVLHPFPWDKAEHFAAFYVLTVLAAAAHPRAPLVILGLWLSLFGCSIELVQALPFIHRDCDIWDWVADAVAIIAASVPLALARWRNAVPFLSD